MELRNLSYTLAVFLHLKLLFCHKTLFGEVEERVKHGSKNRQKDTGCYEQAGISGRTPIAMLMIT